MTTAREVVERLRPCPFCGGAVQFRKALWPSDGCTDAVIHAQPTNCGLSEFDIGTIDEGVLAAWNSRVETTTLQAALDEAVREREDAFMHIASWKKLADERLTRLRAYESGDAGELVARLEAAAQGKYLCIDGPSPPRKLMGTGNPWARLFGEAATAIRARTATGGEG